VSQLAGEPGASNGEQPEHGSEDLGDGALADGNPELHQDIEHHHRNVQSGAARAAVFGVSDGLVTNVSLILGVFGAQPGPEYVRLAGFAGLLAGAFSMAAGEYVSMSAQRELLDRELDVERTALRREPEAERQELAELYENRGLSPEDASQLAELMMRTPEMALQTHAREEIGIDPSAIPSPYPAAVSSLISFSVGAAVPRGQLGMRRRRVLSRDRRPAFAGHGPLACPQRLAPGRRMHARGRGDLCRRAASRHQRGPLSATVS
jgi:VIT1/CCC1 family predicted Fe2+/Mn2+ transporter